MASLTRSTKATILVAFTCLIIAVGARPLHIKSSRQPLQEGACPSQMTQCFTTPYQAQYFCCDSSAGLECSGGPNFECKLYLEVAANVPASLIPNIPGLAQPQAQAQAQPQPQAQVQEVQASPTSPPQTSAPADTPAPDTPAPNTPAPNTPAPDTPAPNTPAPDTPAPDTPPPDTPAPDTPAPNTPAPDTPAPNTPAPNTPAPDTPAPDTPAPNTPAPDTPAPDTPAPDTPAPDTPAPDTPAPNTPSPTSPASDEDRSPTPGPTQGSGSGSLPAQYNTLPSVGTASADGWQTGIATWYTDPNNADYERTACYYNHPEQKPANDYIVALPPHLFGVGPGEGNGPGCGTYWEIRCVGTLAQIGNGLYGGVTSEACLNPNRSLIVKGGDLCPECDEPRNDICSSPDSGYCPPSNGYTAGQPGTHFDLARPAFNLIGNQPDATGIIAIWFRQVGAIPDSQLGLQ